MKTPNSRTCMSCGICCKKYWVYVNTQDEAQRFHWLDSKRIMVEKLEDKLWLVQFDIPCRQLETHRDGTYSCKQHKGDRPQFCRDYPLNFIAPDVPLSVLLYEKARCKELRRILQNHSNIEEP